MFPRDLVLLGAPTGVGKTTLAALLAANCAKQNLVAAVAGLEHYRGEFADRLVFPELSALVRDRRLDFSSWQQGDQRYYTKAQHEEAKRRVREMLGSRLLTQYKDKQFTVDDLDIFLNAVSNQADLVIIDNTQRINRAGELEVQRQIADLLEDYRKAGMRLVVVSQLRKLGSGDRPKIMPTVHDFFGASMLKDTATQTVILAPYQEPNPPHLASTLACVAKDRRGRGNPYTIAKMTFNKAAASYEKAYQLGEIVWERGRPEWQALENNLPLWYKG